VNGRISERSYPRYRMLQRWFSSTLESVSLFVMQSDEDARRVESLGVPPSRIRMKGNLKYDVPPAAPFRDGQRLTAAAAGRPIVVAASTAEGEEDAVVDAWKRLSPRPLLAIAPRRPERFEEVAKKIEAAGFSLLRATREDAGRCDVYLLDTIGELASLYLHAKIAFVGGSLVPRGGHNPIEAWSAGVPVLVGPHVENFREIVEKGRSLGIVHRVADAEDLSSALSKRLADPAATAASGAAARKFVAGNRGSADATADEVLTLLPRAPAKRGAAG